MHGHKKVGAAAGTLAVGGFGGADMLIWIWGILAQNTFVPPMPESVAVQVVSLISLAAFYYTKEDDVYKKSE